MKRKINLIFLMVSCTLFAAYNAEENEEFETVKNLTQSLAKLVRKYNNEFESNGNLDELKAVVSTIDQSMLDYQGLAKNQLDSLRTSYSAAQITYRETVDPVFEWCVAINSTLDLFISQIDNISLSQSDRNTIWKIMAQGVLVSGINKAGSSLKELNYLQSKTKTLNEILGEMLKNIEADFRPNGYYEKRRQEILDRTTPKPWDPASKVVDVISRFFNAIIAFLKAPHRGVAPFKEEFCRKGLDDVVDERRNPTYQEELAAIQLFFKVLGDEIKNAVLISEKVSGDFEKDKRNLEQLSQINKENISKWLESNPELRGRLIPSFQELGKVCADYQILRSNPGPRRPQTTPTPPQRLNAFKY